MGFEERYIVGGRVEIRGAGQQSSTLEASRQAGVYDRYNRIFNVQCLMVCKRYTDFGGYPT